MVALGGSPELKEVGTIAFLHDKCETVAYQQTAQDSSLPCCFYQHSGCSCVTLFLSRHVINQHEGGRHKCYEALGRSKFEMHPFLTESEDVHENLQVSISKNLALGGCVAVLPLAARVSHGSKPCSVTQRKKLVLAQKRCNAALSNR